MNAQVWRQHAFVGQPLANIDPVDGDGFIYGAAGVAAVGRQWFGRAYHETDGLLRRLDLREIKFGKFGVSVKTQTNAQSNISYTAIKPITTVKEDRWRDYPESACPAFRSILFSAAIIDRSVLARKRILLLMLIGWRKAREKTGLRSTRGSS